MKKLLLLSIAVLLIGCNGDDAPKPPPLPPPPPPGSSPVTLSMDASAWRIQFSPTMPATPIPFSGGWFFDFPQPNVPQEKITKAMGVHYLTQAVSGQLNGGVSASFRLEREPGALVMEVEPCGSTNAAKMRLYFQQRGDTMTAQEEYKRWWSKETFDLNTDGPTVMTVPLDPAKWSSVFGKTGDLAPAEFAAAAGDVQSVGGTYGGCFAGHGAYGKGGNVRMIFDRFSTP